ncbi:MAG: VWA domain-containing protein [Bacteroidetes bacterium]|nr:VWA domain-containing protein [Bacteroidota bacterium]
METMNPKHHIHHLVILDESGSMGTIRQKTIDTFNELMSGNDSLVAENPDQEHRITFVTFNGDGIREVFFNAPLNNDLRLTKETYQPRHSTPLFDAMGSSILKVKHLLYGVPNHAVNVTILTDGMENASREFTGKEIKRMVEDLKCRNWAFVYYGTDQDVDAVADQIGISRTNREYYGKEEITTLTKQMMDTRKTVSDKIRRGQNPDADLLSDAKQAYEKKEK